MLPSRQCPLRAWAHGHETKDDIPSNVVKLENAEHSSAGRGIPSEPPSADIVLEHISAVLSDLQE